MAVVAYNAIETPMEGVYIVTWSNLANGDTGKPFVAPHFSHKSVSVTGTFGVAGSCSVEGTLDTGATPTFLVLNDWQGTALTLTANKVKRVLENPYSIRPNVTAGDGTTDLTIRLLMAVASE